jgi:glutathione synthase/RimK-type ligase-like ATP-grasp enzyme
MGQRVAFVTHRGNVELTEDDALGATALRARGVEVDAVPWSAPDVRWEAYGAVVVRSSWDYHRRPDAFRSWLEALQARGANVWNPVPLLQWNMDKRYLLALAERVPTVPTEWVEARRPASLVSLLERRGWDEAVVKPAISGGGDDTWRTARAVAPQAEGRFQALLCRGAVLVQPFVEAVQEEGEYSLVYLGGRFSHGILKRPAAGEFRVQTQHGGQAESRTPSKQTLAQAERVLEAVQTPWAYARVDGCLVDGNFQLMELEMLEPSLELWADPDAPTRFAEAVVERMSPP